MMIISSLLPLIVLIAVAVLIARAILQHRTGDRADTGTSIRRFFHYLVMLAVLGVVATGMAGFIERVLPHPDDLVRDDAALLARSLASILIGGPVLAGLAMWSRRLMAQDPTERDSMGWAFYLTGAMTGALLTSGVSWYRTLRWTFAESSFEPGALAMAVVAGGVWAIHWTVAGRHGSAARLRVNLILGAAAGLVGTAWAAGFGLTATLRGLYDEAFDVTLAGTGGADLRIAAAGLVVAAPIWWWYWLHHAARHERTPLWRGYVLLAGVLGGMLTAVVGAGVLLHSILEWSIGDPGAARAAVHFDVLPIGVATLLVGGAVWWYHRRVLGVRAESERTEVDRMYDYLSSAVGLGAAAGGAVTMIATLVEAASIRGASITEGGEADAFVVGLTLLGVGVPLWLVHWARARAQSRLDAPAEVVSATRRTYLLLVMGVSAVAALFAMLATVITVFEAAFEDRLGAETLRDVRVGLGILAVGALGAVYHAMVFRADRAALPAAARPAVHDVVLVSSNGAAVAAAIAQEVGARVRVWHRLDAPEEGEPEVNDVVDAVRAETHEHVLVLTRAGGGFEIVPFDDR